MGVVNPEEDSGAKPTGRGAPTGGIPVPIAAVDEDSRAEYTVGEVVILDEVTKVDVEAIAK